MSFLHKGKININTHPLSFCSFLFCFIISCRNKNNFYFKGWFPKTLCYNFFPCWFWKTDFFVFYAFYYYHFYLGNYQLEWLSQIGKLLTLNQRKGIFGNAGKGNFSHWGQFQFFCEMKNVLPGHDGLFISIHTIKKQKTHDFI